MFSKAFIDKVKKATDMVALARRYTELTKAGSNVYAGKCPHPDHDDSTPSFRVWADSQSWACMGCHSGRKSKKHGIYGSDCIAFLQWVEGISWREAVLRLAKEAGIPPEEDENQEIYANNLKIAKAYHRNLEPVMPYLKSRGLQQKTIEEFLIGFDGSSITFPLFDRYKNVLGFTKRQFIHEDGPKYKNSKNSQCFNKSAYLYGVHLLDPDFPELRITEGPFDVALAWQAGVKNVVGILGTSFTETHLNRITNSGYTPVFLLDGDEAGRKAARRALDMLQEAGVYSKVFLLPDGQDLAEFVLENGEETERLISNYAMSYGQMLIQDIVQVYDAKMNELRVKLLPDIKAALDQIKNDDERKIVADFIKERMNLNL